METDEIVQKMEKIQAELAEVKNELIKLRNEVKLRMEQSNRFNAGISAAMLSFSIMVFATGLYYQKYGARISDYLFAIMYLTLMALSIYSFYFAKRIVKSENNRL